MRWIIGGIGDIENLIGQTFGYWTVIENIDCRRSLCRCKCGTVKPVYRDALKTGRSKSCGCFQKEYLSKENKKFNTYDLSGEYGIGYTFKGEEFYFDLDDYNKIKDYCWCCNKEGYILSEVNNKMIRLHRLIMSCSDSKIFIDHINHNVKDNRKTNLRMVNNSKNQMNAKIRKNNTSSCCGVSFHKKLSKWCASIQINNKRKFLGCFTKFEDAVIARKQAEEKYFGEYSYDNSMKLLEGE